MNEQEFNEVLEHLPVRRKQVLQKFLAGNTDAEIANLFDIQEGTVRNHICNTCKAFGLGNEEGERFHYRSQLIEWFARFQHEWVSPEKLREIMGAQDVIELPFPDRPVPLDSPFYIERLPLESDCYQTLRKPGSLIRIRGPQQRGKTSLLLRILAHAEKQGFKAVHLNLEEADCSCLADPDQFLRWFCQSISEKLGLEPRLDEYWSMSSNSRVNCKRYFQKEILEKIASPLVLALDNVDRVFGYPQVAREFLPLLRHWYEETNNLKVWRQLRLVVTYSTEVFVNLGIHQSPFNVGKPINLPEFTLEQIGELVKRHNQTWDYREIASHLQEMVGGHPWLIRQALYHLSLSKHSLKQLLDYAPTQGGIYQHHLRRHWDNLQSQPDILTAMQEVVKAEKSVRLDPMATYLLESMGLIRVQGNDVSVSCELYHRYFWDEFSR
ncbi:MAG: hypothetical protein F6J86_24140 [Symploca sp. SIO1B1]|nr:hypothetical protein [Symploca sp. SIO1B1]